MLKILSYGRNSQSIRGDANARQKINLRSYQICNYIYKVKVHHGLFGDNILWFLPSKRSASQQQVAQSLSLTIPLYLEDCQSYGTIAMAFMIRTFSFWQRTELHALWSSVGMAIKVLYTIIIYYQSR